MRILMLLALTALVAVSPAYAQKDIQTKPKAPCKPPVADYTDKPESLVKKYEQREVDIQAMDKDCDGILDGKELVTGRKEKFKAADINKDGLITPSEAKVMLGEVQKENEEEKVNELLTERRVKKMQSRLDGMDKNKDGEISQGEYNAYYESRDKKLDKDGDGKLGITEYRTDTEHKKRSKSRD